MYTWLDCTVVVFFISVLLTKYPVANDILLVYSCPMKTHHLQKWLYLFNNIKFYFRNCVILYCSNSVSYKCTDGSLKRNDHWWHVLEAFNKTAVKTESHTTSHPMCQNFLKTLFSLFSVHRLQRISKLIARNSHLALKVAITSGCDVTSIILTSA